MASEVAGATLFHEGGAHGERVLHVKDLAEWIRALCDGLQTLISLVVRKAAPSTSAKKVRL
jgi:hypothetical protein